MQQHWFHTVWPFAGGGAAIVMVAILLTTDTFRATKGSRWRDPVWLAWLAAPLYWVHGYMRTAAPVVVALASILAACGSGTTSPSGAAVANHRHGRPLRARLPCKRTARHEHHPSEQLTLTARCRDEL